MANSNDDLGASAASCWLDELPAAGWRADASIDGPDELDELDDGVADCQVDDELDDELDDGRADFQVDDELDDERGEASSSRRITPELSGADDELEPPSRAAKASAETAVLGALSATGLRRTVSVPERARGAATGADGANGDLAMIDAICSARRSSGLSSTSSKNRGVGEGCATWVSSWATTSSMRRRGIAE